MSDAIVIVGAKRTAIGSMLGQFTGVPTPTLGAAAIRAALQQSGVAPEEVSEVIMGCVLPANLGQAPARQASLAAGIPTAVGCTTINKVCGSGMKAIMFGHDLIKAGSATVVVAGGMESMTNAPHMVAARAGLRYGEAKLVDHMAWDGLTNPYDGRAMGIFAEQCVDKYSFTREEQDAFATESVKRALAAQQHGVLKDEIVPVTVKGRKGEVVVDTDEEPARCDLSKIPTLKPAFKKEGGSVTAASSSSISDGAAATVLMSAEEAQRRGLQPLARIVAHATHAQEPEGFTTAPVHAIRNLLESRGRRFVRDQRGVRGGRDGADARTRHPAREAQRARRRLRDGPSHRRHRRAYRGQPVECDACPRCTARHCSAVHRWRRGYRNRDRARLDPARRYRRLNENT